MADLYQQRGPVDEPLDALYVVQCTDLNAFGRLQFPPKDRKALKAKAKALGPRGEEGELISGECPLGLARRITFVGLGDKDALTHARLRGALRRLVRQAAKNREYQIGLAIPVRIRDLSQEESRLLTILEAALGDYTYDSFKSKKNEFDKIDGIHFVPVTGEDEDKLEQHLDRVRLLVGAIRQVRDLGNRPASSLTPEALAAVAREMADDNEGLRLTVLGPKELAKANMGGIEAVARGSTEEPRLIILEHRPKKPKKSVVLVGKGVTFDSGGISLKPAKSMEWMKYDMAGAATVMAVMAAVHSLELPIKVVGLVPAAENMPSGTALKPGDVVTMSNGKTVEVDNTDAEGRLLLADALAYSEKFNPDYVIDLATLTGSCIAALGHEAAGLMGNDPKLIDRMVKLGDEFGERVWSLPLYDEYLEYLKSDWADMKNAGSRWGGVVTAGKFLEQFVPENTSWAHLDLAGVAYMEHEHNGYGKGATGFGVLLLLKFLERLLP